jgi:hypothetical protein
VMDALDLAAAPGLQDICNSLVPARPQASADLRPAPLKDGAGRYQGATGSCTRMSVTKLWRDRAARDHDVHVGLVADDWIQVERQRGLVGIHAHVERRGSEISAEVSRRIGG